MKLEVTSTVSRKILEFETKMKYFKKVVKYLEEFAVFWSTLGAISLWNMARDNGVTRASKE